MLELRIASESALDSRTDAAIRTALCVGFPADREVFARTRAWHGSSPAWSVWLEDDGTVIAHAGVVDRTVLAGEAAVRVAGVQNLCVVPDYRGRGFCKRVMEAAMDEAARRGHQCGLLFCTAALGTIYERLGWRFLDRAVTRIDSGRPLPLPEGNRPMVYPLSLRAMPPGPIDLQGNDW